MRDNRKNDTMNNQNRNKKNNNNFNSNDHAVEFQFGTDGEESEEQMLEEEEISELRQNENSASTFYFQEIEIIKNKNYIKKKLKMY